MKPVIWEVKETLHVPIVTLFHQMPMIYKQNKQEENDKSDIY